MAFPFLTALPIIGDLLDKLIPDLQGEKKAEAQRALILLNSTIEETKSQREINKVEAGHSSIFVAGWRPFVGWICALALAYNCLVRPILIWVSVVFWNESFIPPSIDDVLWELLFGMLGMGGLRSYEKVRGVSK